jgi:hypothetical protein
MIKLVCLTIVSLLLLTFSGCNITKGGIIVNEKIPGKEFEIEFSKWSNENKFLLPMNQNDELQIEIINGSGTISLKISDLKGDSIYNGTGLGSASFIVKAPHDGDYLITMKGRNASGVISIKTLPR